MPHEIDISEDTMQLLTSSGEGVDCHILEDDGEPEALLKLREWRETYEFDLGFAERQVQDYYA